LGGAGFALLSDIWGDRAEQDLKRSRSESTDSTITISIVGIDAIPVAHRLHDRQFLEERVAWFVGKGRESLIGAELS